MKNNPVNWEEAIEWSKKANSRITDNEFNLPRWSWDCGMKLDYDGSIITVSSRYYAPTDNISEYWTGNVIIYLCGKEIDRKRISCEDLDSLEKGVDNYIKKIIKKIETTFL